MRVLVAGASGVVGVPTVQVLRAAGHEVVALGRRVEPLSAMGIEARAADALDADAVLRAFMELRPDAVVHQLTALPQRIRPQKLHEDIGPTNRLRTAGTRNLLAAARAVGARRFVAQSIAFWARPDGSSALAVESDKLFEDADAKSGFREMVAAVVDLEAQVVGAGGVALRYGMFYGPKTVFATDGTFTAEMRRRRMPIVGRGAGRFSLVHTWDAARAALLAIERDVAGVYHIVDDDPVAARDFLPELAKIHGAKRPWRVPVWLARFAAGKYGIFMMTQMRGVSNAKAKAELGWSPRFTSWRQGMRDFGDAWPVS